MVAQYNTNDQYQTLVRRRPEMAPQPGLPRYVTSSEMSIEFEVDGPYRVSLLGPARGAELTGEGLYPGADIASEREGL